MYLQNEVSAVAKPFVQEELGAIIKRERSRREQLWVSGVVKSARMTPRVCQNHISTEEVLRQHRKLVLNDQSWQEVGLYQSKNILGF